MSPLEAKFPGFQFIIKGEEFFIGLFSIDDPGYPNATYPLLLVLEDGEWIEIDRRQIIWIDQREDFTPETMANLIIKDFNVTLADRGGVPMTWSQKLAAIFRLGIEVQGNQLVKKQVMPG